MAQDGFVILPTIEYASDLDGIGFHTVGDNDPATNGVNLDADP
jgi:hypothetical protein